MVAGRICAVTTISATMKSFLVDQMLFLQKKGYEVTLVCDTDEEFRKSLPLEIVYKPVPMKRGIDGFEALKSIFEMYRIFQKDRYDLVQYSTPNAALYASIAAWLARVPVRLYCQWGIRYVGFSGWKRSIFKLIEKAVCWLSTDIQPDSLSNIEFCIEEGLYGTQKGRVIWNGSANGVNLTKFDIGWREAWRAAIREKYGIASTDFVFGFVGSITKDKGINELLAAFKGISQDNSHTRLLLVGDEEFINQLDGELLRWSKDSDRVVYCGETNEVEKYMAAMDIFILPSYREGFGTVIIEAESMGLPVIVTDIPGPINAIIKDKTGLVVPKAQVEPLASSMTLLIKNNELRKAMSNEAVSFARKSFEQQELWRRILENRDYLIRKSKEAGFKAL